MTVLDTKIELIQWVSTIQDPEILEKLIKFKQQESKDWWNTVSIKEQESIEKGISDTESGKLNPHSTARKLYEKWL